MFGWTRSREGSNVLAEPTPQSTAQYLCRLMEEQNQLLRELILSTTGRQALTAKAGGVNRTSDKVRTDKDVFRVTRETTEQRLRKEATTQTRQIPVSGPDSRSNTTPVDVAERPSLPPDTM